MTSFRRKNANAQTAIRLALLENGYTPVPNIDKRCMFKGWGVIRPTPEDIADWSRKLDYQATGLRVEGGLCAIDVDIDDEKIVAAIWERSVERFPQLREALIRFGSGAKEMWLCRSDEPFSVLFSTTHVKPGRDPEGANVPGYRIEAFGGGHTRQFGVYGAHTMGDDDQGFDVEYVWADDTGPVEVPLSGLPLIGKGAVLAITQIAQEELERAKWPRVLRSRAGEAQGATVYDLTDEMRFDCLDDVRRTLGELDAYARTSRDPRCSAGWTGDRTLVNRTRCLVGVDHTGEVSVLETANWTRHMAAKLADREMTPGERVSKLSDKIREKLPELDLSHLTDPSPTFRDAVFDLLENWAWCGSRSTPCLPIHQPEEYGMSVQNLRLTLARFNHQEPGPRGGTKTYSPVDVWMTSESRIDVEGYRFMPDKPPGVFEYDGIRAINSYRGVVHAAEPAGADRARHLDLFNDFMLHLLPSEVERSWFVDMLAHKAQHPTVPGVAVLMVAKDFGVGRGTLFDMLGGIFGQRYVRNVSAGQLLGDTSQSQYTDWQAGCLIAVTDEVLSSGDDGVSMGWARKKAYEKLKERIDPRAREVMIVRKGLPNYNEKVYAWHVMSTNHGNALPLPKGERRVSVLSNGPETLAARPDLKRRIDAARGDELFASAVWHMLLRRDVSKLDAYVAPAFKGKELMVEANLSELDAIMADVLDAMPYEWATEAAILDRCEATLARRNLKDQFPNWRRHAIDAARNQWVHIGRKYVGEGRGVKVQVLIRTAQGEKAFDETSRHDRGLAILEMSKLDKVADPRLQALRRGIAEV